MIISMEIAVSSISNKVLQLNLVQGLPFLLEEICGPILGIYKSLTDT
jgi:hypothetical protein